MASKKEKYFKVRHACGFNFLGSSYQDNNNGLREEPDSGCPKDWKTLEQRSIKTDYNPILIHYKQSSGIIALNVPMPKRRYGLAISAAETCSITAAQAEYRNP